MRHFPSPMPKLVVLNHGRGEMAHVLSATIATIGRAEENNIRIIDTTVSNRHCEAQLRGNELQVRDLNSTNGTFINGAKIAEGTLRRGKILRVGEVELRLQVHVPPMSPDVASLISRAVAAVTSAATAPAAE